MKFSNRSLKIQIKFFILGKHMSKRQKCSALGSKLYKACIEDNSELAIKLIEQGADVNYVDDGHDTVLMCACRHGLGDVALRLIAAGANVNYMNDDHNTALIYACCSNNFVKVALKLIDFGANVNQVNDREDTALICACQVGLGDVALRLIEKGANVNHVNKFNYTALIWACCEGLGDVALRLIEAGANVNHASNNHDTPLKWACWKRLGQVTLRLIHEGADVNHKDHKGCTPLSWACWSGLDGDVVLKLVATGAVCSGDKIEFLEKISMHQCLLAKSQIPLELRNDSRANFIGDLFYREARGKILPFACCVSSRHMPNALPKLCVELIVENLFELYHQQLNALFV